MKQNFVLVFPLLPYEERLLLRDEGSKQECYWCGDNFYSKRKKKFCSTDCREENRTYKFGDLTKNVHLSRNEGFKACLWCGIDHKEKGHYCGEKCKSAHMLSSRKAFTQQDIYTGTDFSDKDAIECYGHCNLSERAIDLISCPDDEESYTHEDVQELFSIMYEEMGMPAYSDGSAYQPKNTNKKHLYYFRRRDENKHRDRTD